MRALLPWKSLKAVLSITPMDINALLKMLERGQDSPMLRFTLGQACVNANDWEGAIKHLRACLTQDRNYSAAWQLLGQALQKSGRLEEALEALDQGLQVAHEKGDKQAWKVMRVYRKRVSKALDLPPRPPLNPQS